MHCHSSSLRRLIDELTMRLQVVPFHPAVCVRILRHRFERGTPLRIPRDLTRQRPDGGDFQISVVSGEKPKRCQGGREILSVALAADNDLERSEVLGLAYLNGTRLGTQIYVDVHV